MKAKLIFDLTDSDDRMEHGCCVKAGDMALVLWNLVYNSKKELERRIDGNDKLSAYDTLDMVFEKINNLLEEHGIIIDELTN